MMSYQNVQGKSINRSLNLDEQLPYFEEKPFRLQYNCSTFLSQKNYVNIIFNDLS